MLSGNNDHGGRLYRDCVHDNITKLTDGEFDVCVTGTSERFTLNLRSLASLRFSSIRLVTSYREISQSKNRPTMT